MLDDEPSLANSQLPANGANASSPGAVSDRCDICDSDRLTWRNCKLLCENCRSIVKSCADL